MAKRAARQLCLALALLCALALGLPCTAMAAEAPPEVGAEAWLVMDAKTGQVLVSQNADAARYPASITKIMTMALVLENIDEENRANGVEVSQAAVDALIPRASMVSLAVGEVASVNDLLYATKIESANDASNVLAEHVAGSMDGFAAMMNEKLAELGLEGSHFVNPSGQPDDDHYVTAHDMAAVTRWALTVPGFKELFGALEYQMGPTNKAQGGRSFHNANLIASPGSYYYCEGVTGSKTGYTDAARYTLVTTAARGDTELICVVLNCEFNSEKYNSTNALLDYCFDNFNRVRCPVGELAACKVPVFGGGQVPLGEIDLYTESEVEVLLHKSLGLGSVQIYTSVPERYVIGEAFAPSVEIHLAQGSAQQQGGLVATVPMAWTGLDKILADNTTGGGWGQMAEEKPVLFWLLIALPALLLALVAGRIGWVQYRRAKRRRRRLEAVMAQRPIAIADRPPPPEKQARDKTHTQPVDRRRPAQPRLRVVEGRAAAPRRAGRAK